MVLSTGLPSRYTIEIDINDIQVGTAIYIFSTGEVILNKRAYELLGMKSNQVFDLTTWNKINPFMKDIVKKHGKDSVIEQRVQVFLFDGKQEILKYSLGTITTAALGRVYLVHFGKMYDSQSPSTTSSLSSIKEELAQLKPYLNRTGKAMHRRFMKHHFGEDNRQLTLDDLVYYERELRVIQQAFPLLTHREVILCCLLVSDFDISEIALITNRTPESVSVTIHRINKKLDFMNRKELIDNLKELVREENGNNGEPG